MQNQFKGLTPSVTARGRASSDPLPLRQGAPAYRPPSEFALMAQIIMSLPAALAEVECADDLSVLHIPLMLVDVLHLAHRQHAVILIA